MRRLAQADPGAAGIGVDWRPRGRPTAPRCGAVTLTPLRVAEGWAPPQRAAVARANRGAAALVLLAARAAAAQTALVPHQPDFSVERLTPAPGPGGFWQVEDAEVGTAFALVTSLATRPLVIRDVRMGSTLTEPVALRLGLDLTGSLAWGRFQLGAGLPLVVFQDGDRLRGLDLMEPGAESALRSEERRVGKECRSRWSPYH